MGKPNVVYTSGVLFSFRKEGVSDRFVFFYLMVSQVCPQEKRCRKTKFIILTGPRFRKDAIQDHVEKTPGWSGGRRQGKMVVMVVGQLGCDLNWSFLRGTAGQVNS